ncbi:MAG: M20/M25/M40 family metallo-hydrolase [Croceivirga sp.]|mgnify:CR=1 FL=1
MNYLFALGCFLVLLTCGSTKRVQTASETDGMSREVSQLDGPDGLKAEIPIEPLFTSARQVESIMNYLASDELKGRDTGSEGIELAAQYLEKHFTENDVSPYYETYRDTLSNFKKPAYNIVGMIEGSDLVLKEEYIIIGAHYDHIGTIRPENGDYIANGANDNASGTTAVMELARYFGKNKSNKRSLIFALFSAEEKGLLGSRHMAKNMKEANFNLYVMLNFEMLGVPLRSKKYELYITGYNKSNLAEIANDHAGEHLIGYLPTAQKYGLFQRSDNYDFYKEFGVPSHTFCTFDFTNFEFYHKVNDEVDEMDFEHMARVINKMIPVVEGIANAPTQEIKMNN